MSKLKSVRYLWHRYRQDVVPKNAEGVQVEETRRAFYAGMWKMIEMMERMGEADISEKEALDHLDDVKADLQEWVAGSIERQIEQN